MYLDLGLFSIIAFRFVGFVLLLGFSFCMWGWLVGWLTLWTNSIKIKAIKLQADFNDRQSLIGDGRAESSRCLGLCLFVAIVFLDILRLSDVAGDVDVVAADADAAAADVVVPIAVDCPDVDVDFRRKCFLNILYILWAFVSVMLVGISWRS